QQQQQASAQQDESSTIIQSCLDLATAIQEAAATLETAAAASFDLANDITCHDYITIESGQNITIRSSSSSSSSSVTGTTTTTQTTTTITIAADFAANSTSQSVLDVEEGGILTLDGIKCVQEEVERRDEGLRAIYNRGTLTITNK
ncbi:unnamed protein product, partial [Laminaria digitata]